MFSIPWTRAGPIKFPNTLLIISMFFVIMDLTVGNKQCKSTVMKIVMRQCSQAGIISTRHNGGHFRPEHQPNIENEYRDGYADEEELIGRKIQRWHKRIAEIFQVEETSPHAVENDERMDLGDLTGEEIDQLYSKIVLARPRSVRDTHETPEDAKNLFLKIAARCCRKEETCTGENIVSRV